MKKTLIALAVAGVIAAPAAMAEVTVYGLAHISLDNVSGDGGDQSLAVTNRASRIGVKAAEDLGNGLTAVAQMEWGVDMADQGGSVGACASSDLDADTDGQADTGSISTACGNGNLTSRNQIIGLAGSFGTIAVGRHDTPYKMSTGSLDVFADTAADYNLIIGEDLRVSNAIAYLSPDMNGFSVQAAIVAADVDADGDGDDDDAADATSIAAQYKAGPLFVAAAMEQFAADDTPSATKLGVGYDLGAAKVGFVYQSITDAVPGDDYTAMLVNVAVPMGGNTLIAEYGQANLDKADVDTTLAAVGVAHGFSKSTSAYVAYGNVNVDVGGASGDVNILTAGMVVKF